MRRYSTREAAHELGLDFRTIQRYLAAGKIPAPPVERIGGGRFRAWTAEDIERVRKILPKIKNGRKTRYEKKQLAIGNKQLAKSKSKTKTQPRAAGLHKKSQKKK